MSRTEVGETREGVGFVQNMLNLICILHFEVVDEIVILLQTMLSSYLKTSSKHLDVRIWDSVEVSESEV